MFIIKPSELFTEISEQEQETVAGGRSYSRTNNIFSVTIQKTNISTFANSEVYYSNGDQSFVQKSQTGYTLSELNVSINIAANHYHSTGLKNGFGLGILTFLFYF